MNRYELSVKHIKRDGYHLYIEFEKPEGLIFEDGQYGVFLHVDKEVEGRKMRAFSFASSNDEDILLIGTKLVEPISSFKQHMLALEVGDTMALSGPTGSFTIEHDYPKVFIAGGIGITPIRSMLKGLRHYNDATLLFSEASSNYPFLDDITHPDVTIHLLSGKDDTTEQVAQTVTTQSNDTYYYLAGSHGFVNGIAAQLESLGISKDHIKYDRFTGY